MENGSLLCWFAWLAVFYREEFYRKLLTVARFRGQLHCLLGWKGLIILMCVTRLSYSQFQFTYALMSTRTSFPPQCSTFTSLTPSSSYCLSPLPLKTSRAVLNCSYPLTQASYILSPDCPELSWERERNKKSQLWGFFITFSSSPLLIPTNSGGLWPLCPPLISFLSIFWIFIL